MYAWDGCEMYAVDILHNLTVTNIVTSVTTVVLLVRNNAAVLNNAMQDLCFFSKVVLKTHEKIQLTTWQLINRL